MCLPKAGRLKLEVNSGDVRFVYFRGAILRRPVEAMRALTLVRRLETALRVSLCLRDPGSFARVYLDLDARSRALCAGIGDTRFNLPQADETCVRRVVLPLRPKGRRRNSPSY